MEKNNLHPLLQKIITAITLFSGAGGGTLGLQYAYINELLAIDYWRVAQKAFEANFTGDRHIPFWLADISAISPVDILRKAMIEAGELCIMLLSPPCQGFSVAKGKLNPLDFRNALFLDGINLIAGVLPKIFIIENVPGMDDPRNISIFNEIKIRIREQLGPHYNYKCFKLLVLNHGTPQLRYRLIFIGYKKEWNIIPTPPKPDYESHKHLRIVDIAPEITAVKVGQSRKTYKHNSKYMNTICAAEGGTTIFSDGKEGKLKIEQLKRFASFPEWYQIPGDISYKDAHALIGNSIAPLFMKDIAQHILSEVGDKL